MKKHIFISYCRENKTEVAQLREKLLAAGESVWWDEDILGGALWKKSIKDAMKVAYAVIVCFSKEVEERATSGIYPEIQDAIDAYRSHKPGSIFLIPIRLSNCTIPDIAIDDRKALNDIQYLDLYPPHQSEYGFQKLLETIKSATLRP